MHADVQRRVHLRVLAALVLLLGAASADGEVLIRWDQETIPSATSLGIAALVVPAANTSALRNALGAGYRVYLEVEASSLMTFIPPAGIAGVVVKGQATQAQMRVLRRRVTSPGSRVIVPEAQGKWPHIRSNWVTKNKDAVLQVTGRSAQPWIENNAALLRMAVAARPRSTPVLTYAWQPITLSDVDEGPALENYLVAIAEAGSFGADLVLPLHPQFQKRLILGHPQARAEWDEIQRYLRFYSWNLVGQYRPLATVGVVTANPTLWFEVMNLMMRHNLPFEVIGPADLPKRNLDGLKLLVMLDEPDAGQRAALESFAAAGGAFKIVTGPVDPNRFALEARQLLGRAHRVVDIWNGITVLATPYANPDGTGALLTVLNYAHQPLPVQLRVAGTYSQVHYESPEEAPAVVPYQHRDGFTEFVIPGLRIGGRVFLTRRSTPVP
jgi:hypothetical protein